jgi:hypothetical protein
VPQYQPEERPQYQPEQQHHQQHPRLVGSHLCCVREETDEVPGWTNPPSKKGKKAFYCSWLAELQNGRMTRTRGNDDNNNKDQVPADTVQTKKGLKKYFRTTLTLYGIHDYKFI